MMEDAVQQDAYASVKHNSIFSVRNAIRSLPVAIQHALSKGFGCLYRVVVRIVQALQQLQLAVCQTALTERVSVTVTSCLNRSMQLPVHTRLCAAGADSIFKPNCQQDKVVCDTRTLRHVAYCSTRAGTVTPQVACPKPQFLCHT